MRRYVQRALSLALIVVVLLGPASLAAASPAAPVVTLFADIPSPDGRAGWWRTAPEAFGQSDQDAVLHYDWGAAETTLPVTGGSVTSVGFAPEGESTVTAFAVNALDEQSLAVTKRFRVDSVPPSRPEDLSGGVDGQQVTLTWTASTDDGSGVDGYRVYRNRTGPPFSEGDLLAFTTAASHSYADTDGGVWFYGVAATDEAGNDSLMSGATRISDDVTPPTAPSDLAAWANGRGFVRVSWGPSFDARSGVAVYVVTRAFPGQEPSVVATVPSSALYWDDVDLDAVAEECEYAVSAVDRSDNVSPVSGPVVRGVDTEAPAAPARMFASGHLPPDTAPLHLIPVAFDLGWDAAAETGSGVSRYEVAYGPDPETPAWSRYADASELLVSTSAEWAHWWFSVRAEDRAGNWSAWASAEQRVATVDEVSGDDRVATALAASRETFDGATDVVVASSRSFPDGLCAASLAGTVRGPVLLVPPGALRADVVAELDRLGAENAWVIGGSSSVTTETLLSLDAALSGTVTRVAGADRYATAAEVAAVVRDLRGEAPRGIIVVSGRNFPDALSAGPIAYATGWPFVYATPTGLPPVSRQSVASSGASETLILGDKTSVWAGVESLTPDPERLSGIDRYATSAMTAEWAVGRGILTAARPVLATGITFPDGLAAGPFAGERGSPVLLSRPGDLPWQPTGFLGGHAEDVRRVTALGGALDGWSVYVEAWVAVQILPLPPVPKMPAPKHGL